MKGPKRPARNAREAIVHIDVDTRVRPVRLATRALLVVSSDEDLSIYSDISGAIVWVRPAQGATPEQVAAAVARLRAAGAVRVLPMPPEAEAAAVPAVVHVTAPEQNLSVREVVDELLAEVIEQPEAVREIVERALSEAGL